LGRAGYAGRMSFHPSLHDHLVGLSGSQPLHSCVGTLASWRSKLGLGLLFATVGCVAHRSITVDDVQLVSDPLFRSGSAFSPNVVAWLEQGDPSYGLVMLEGRRRRVVDFDMPMRLGGGLGIGWMGFRDSGDDTEELCVAVPDIRCAPAPDVSPFSSGLQVGRVDGAPAVWFSNDMTARELYLLVEDSWQPVELPRLIQMSWASVLPTGDGLLRVRRGELDIWTLQDGEWVTTALPQSASGEATLSETQLYWVEVGPTPKPKGPLSFHDNRTPESGWLNRLALDGTASSKVQVDVGHVRLLVPHGEDGILIVGSYQAEYWRGDERMWQLPSTGMSGASWEGHPWVSVGSTRMRLDGPSIEVEDPVPGRFVWSERITPELVACGDGLGLAWSHDDTRWHAWMAHGHVQIGHDCPEKVDPWPRGKLGECAKGTRLEEGDQVACVAVSTRQRVTRTSIVQLARH